MSEATSESLSSTTVTPRALYEMQRMRQQSFQVQLEYKGKKIQLLVHKKKGLTESMILMGMQLPVYDRIHLSLISLTCGHEVIPYEIVKFTSSNIRRIPFDDLEPEKLYEVNMQDDREEFIQKLTDEERSDIEKKFAAIDTNDDGKLSFSEVVNLYTNTNDRMKIEMRKEMEKVRESKKSQHSRDKIDDLIVLQEKRLDRLKELNINMFQTELGLTEEGEISKDDFIKHEAKIAVVLRRSQKQS